jgi:hypothetical protein
MRLPDQMRRSPNFDIRLCVHTGMDFDINGHLTPLFDGILYLMIPQWANISSIEDLKKVKMNIAGEEISFSNLDLSRIDQSKLKFRIKTDEKARTEPEEIIQTSNESKSWFSRWFDTTPTPSIPPPPQSSPPPSTPLTRKI